MILNHKRSQIVSLTISSEIYFQHVCRFSSAGLKLVFEFNCQDRSDVVKGRSKMTFQFNIAVYDSYDVFLRHK